MILNDVLSEYKYVYETLVPCQDYFIVCNNLIYDFFNNISSKVATCNMPFPSDGEKDTISKGVNEAFGRAYINISKLVASCYPLYGAMAKFEEYHFNVPFLEYHVRDFLSSAHNVINVTNPIIAMQGFGMKSNNKLPDIIPPLLDLVQHYHSLQQCYVHLKNIDEILFEDVPAIVSESEKYNRIELHSLKPSLDMDSFINDVKTLSSFIRQFELIMTSENGPCKIYTQRIESGSLRIVWGSNTIELSSISDIIKEIFEGIKMFRLTPAEKRLKNEKARALKLENDEKELAIINLQIDSITRITGLSSEKPEDIEKLQKLCLPIVRYLYSNPVGVIGDYKYDLNNELKLIESVYK